MAKKSANRRGKSETKKSNLLAIFVVIAMVVVIGGGALWFRGGGEAERPGPRTADNRLVVMEFSDFG